MPTPVESAQLILKLYELRREPVLREARAWFIREFHPDSVDDVKAAMATERNPHMRMVVGYWDMACSLVVHGAIDREMFLDANGEVFGTFAKIQPLLGAIRESMSSPAFAKHIEAVVMPVPGILDRLEMLRQRFRAMAAAAATRAAASPSA